MGLHLNKALQKTALVFFKSNLFLMASFSSMLCDPQNPNVFHYHVLRNGSL